LAILLLLWAALHGYVFWRVQSIPVVARHVPRTFTFVLGALLWAGFPLSQMLANPNRSRVDYCVAFAGTAWIGVFFLLFVATVVSDLLTGFGWLFPAWAPSVRGWALGASCLLSVMALIQGMRPPAISNYDVQLPGLPPERDGTVVLVASDLHLGDTLGQNWLEARIHQIEAQRPDMIVLAGDILEAREESAAFLVPVLQRLAAPLGVWAVNGNHEGYGSPQEIRPGSTTLLDSTGFHVLHNTWAQASPGLIVAGVDDLSIAPWRRSSDPTASVSRALADRPQGATIFVSHAPVLAEQAAQLGTGLMLSGHTHNGQIWPFNYVLRLLYPLLTGRYEVQGMTVLVSRGAGTWGPRMRLWQRGEILRVVLHCSH
jgi:uncharacterized protein